MGGVRNSLNLALYTYAHQNPVKLTDPDGNRTAIPPNTPPQVTTWTKLVEIAKNTGKVLGSAAGAVVEYAPMVIAAVAVAVLPQSSSDPNAGKTSQTKDDDSRGPVYHRLESDTQTPADAARQAKTGEIWGKENRTQGGGTSPFKSVDAYKGPLPDGARGVEFITPVPESGGHPAKARWVEGSPGVTPASNPDYVKIQVIITKNTQTD